MTTLATVFDGLIPASANPGVDFGAPVVVWTPTVSGIYQIMAQAPDEPGSPFYFADNVLVDMDSLVVPGIQFDPLWAGNVADEFQQGDPMPAASLEMVTTRGVSPRVVVKVGLVAALSGSGSDASMIVPLEEIKVALGIEPGDDSEDVLLRQLESYAAAYVESQTERRWRAPAEKVEYQFGNSQRTLFLEGYVEAAVPVITIREGGPGAWTPFTDFEFRKPNKLVRSDGYGWHPGIEYEITYQDGWTVAPPDIRNLVLDLMTIAWNASDSGEEAAIKSETIGDYSYTLESVSSGASSLSSASVDTLNRRRAKHI